MNLTRDEHDALHDLVRAGTDGLTIERVGLSYALRLQLAGHARISTDTPQRVFATSQGRAFSQRSVFA